MTLPVQWQQDARNDLAAIIKFVAAQNTSAARALKAQIQDATVGLSDHPYLARNGRVPGTRELVAHPNYIVIYEVTASTVEILAVVHARQQYP
jgi:toxin ParE1/3/4